MRFLVVGGGCFGSFYARQLLRAGDRLQVTSIDVIDHDPACQAHREFSSQNDPRLRFFVSDWKNFLLDYFQDQLLLLKSGKVLDDYYIPPTLAPHILFEIFLELVRLEFPSTRFEKMRMEQPIGTPVDMSLPAGTRALSFATWICPATCIEPPTCPHTRGSKSWDMKTFLTAQKIETDLLLIFQTSHIGMGVSGISVREILEEYKKFHEAVLSQKTFRAAMATVSSCHGLIGVVSAIDP